MLWYYLALRGEQLHLALGGLGSHPEVWELSKGLEKSKVKKSRKF